MNTAMIKRQHEDILALIDEIDDSLDPTYLQENAFQVSLKLGSLAGKLMIHLNTEDQHLYPRLLADDNSAATTKRFITEMEDITKVFNNYKTRYNSANAIKENIVRFISETENLFNALRKRIEKEESQLLPLLK
ncbi:MAG: hemerythrin domain-containing protein [Firmicutes bacterium]|nr:hemerythrin domain-containing protein [Bacillota bacterium]